MIPISKYYGKNPAFLNAKSMAHVAVLQKEELPSGIIPRMRKLISRAIILIAMRHIHDAGFLTLFTIAQIVLKISSPHWRGDRDDEP